MKAKKPTAVFSGTHKVLPAAAFPPQFQHAEEIYLFKPEKELMQIKGCHIFFTAKSRPKTGGLFY